MTKHKRQKISVLSFVIVSVIAIVILLIAGNFSKYQSQDATGEETVTATVVEIIDIQQDEVAEGFNYTTITFLAEMTSGKQKGETIKMIQTIDEMFLPVPETVKEGDKIIAILAMMGENAEWVYGGVNRIGDMILMVGVFLLLIIIIGRWKGFATIMSLALTVGVIFYVYIPSILRGRNIYLTTIIVAIYIVLFSLVLLNGFNKKTLCAMVGNVGGTLIAGVLAILFSKMLAITGVLDQDYVFLMLVDGDTSINLIAVVWGGILIGSLGAIMDVAMSIASAMHELSEQMERKTFGRMVRSGMRIGRDAIGTMTNTLILAYVGSSLATVLLFVVYQKSPLVLWNLEMIVAEVLQAVVGSMGILIAVPLTVFFSAGMYMKSPSVSKNISQQKVATETSQEENSKPQDDE